jgi:hypothetical protein
MNARTGLASQIEPAVEVRGAVGMGFDHVQAPGMALVGFFTGSVFSLGIWFLLGWAAWHLAS